MNNLTAIFNEAIKVDEPKNGYIVLLKGKKYEVKANSTYEACCKLRGQLKLKGTTGMSAYLVEKNGKEVLQSTII